jgi:hypothetical protein
MDKNKVFFVNFFTVYKFNEFFLLESRKFENINKIKKKNFKHSVVVIKMSCRNGEG